METEAEIMKDRKHRSMQCNRATVMVTAERAGEVELPENIAATVS